MSKWTNWQCIYNDSWTVEFKNIVRKRLPYSISIAEDTMLDVRQELAINLAALEAAPLSVNAYLRTAFRNTLEDYLRKKNGYPRPPEWIKQLGATYERIYKLLCLENRAVNDIHATMFSLYQHSRDFIENIITEVRAGVVNCGSWRETVSVDDALSEMESVEHSNFIAQSPDAILNEMNNTAVFEAILGERAANDDSLCTENLIEILKKFQETSLQDDERLLLRMIYTDGYSVSKAARLMGLADKKARKQLQLTLKNLQQTLLACGISDL